jgi:L-lysine 2,3-aminomutase
VTSEKRYVPTEREKAFQATIENPKYERDSINGLTPFFKDKAPADIKKFYSAEELSALAALKDTERDVEARMPVKITRHFFEMAQNSKPLQRIVKANPDETLNLAGSEDPGYQMDFAPVEGLLHKYEMGLLYAVSTCSAHCRFCYREELISQKEVERQDGTVAKKGLAQIKAVTNYIRAHKATRWCCRTARSGPGFLHSRRRALNPFVSVPRKCRFIRSALTMLSYR